MERLGVDSSSVGDELPDDACDDGDEEEDMHSALPSWAEHNDATDEWWLEEDSGVLHACNCNDEVVATKDMDVSELGGTSAECNGAMLSDVYYECDDNDDCEAGEDCIEWGETFYECDDNDLSPLGKERIEWDKWEGDEAGYGDGDDERDAGDDRE